MALGLAEPGSPSGPASPALFHAALDGYIQLGELGIVCLNSDKSVKGSRGEAVDCNLDLNLAAILKLRALCPEFESVEIGHCRNLEILATLLINHQRLIDKIR